MRHQRIAILVIVGAAIALSVAAGTPEVPDPADMQKDVVGEDHGNTTGDDGRLHAPGQSGRPARTPRPFSDGAVPPRSAGKGIGPNRTVPAGPTIDLPTPAPTPAPRVGPLRPGVRFGQRRYLVGASPLTPPIGNATVPGRALGTARSRNVLGTGTATGIIPPRARFARWSPAARWRLAL